MDQKKREQFLDYFVHQLAKHADFKYDLEVSYTTDGKTLAHQGIAGKHFISLPENLLEFKDPLILLAGTAHEVLGHGRAFENNKLSKNSSRDSEIVNLQNQFSGQYYVEHSENVQLYEKQPAEVHAKNAEYVFLAEFLSEAKKTKADLDKEQITLLKICLERQIKQIDKFALKYTKTPQILTDNFKIRESWTDLAKHKQSEKILF